MPRFAPGQTVQISCDIQPGAFPSEYLVTFQTTEGPVSGFVRAEHVRRAGHDKGYIFATVHGVSEDTLTVIVRGSFFTTTGLAHLSTDRANSHVREAHS
jgi:hypothetical protein